MNENHTIIQNIIEANDACPEFVYQNPLLDKNVAKALSTSFIKILKISSQNTSTNNNLRRSILENIRKYCTVEPQGHAKVDDTFTEMLTELYQAKFDEDPSNTLDSVDRQLDAYLVRKLKHLDINSGFQSVVNPEIIQALMNLNKNGFYMDILAKDVINWNATVTKHITVLNMLWGEDTSDDLKNDISIKMKPQIEMLLLNVCSSMLETKNQNVQGILTTNNDLMELIKMCAKSPQCFQMCSGILNFIFIMTNFDPEIQRFIPEFVKSVKAICDPETVTSLYPYHLSTSVILLDFYLDCLTEDLKKIYVDKTLEHLSRVHRISENDVILVLSHYPFWFDLYFSQGSDDLEPLVPKMVYATNSV